MVFQSRVYEGCKDKMSKGTLKEDISSTDRPREHTGKTGSRRRRRRASTGASSLATREGVSDASDECFSEMSYSSEVASRFSYVSSDGEDNGVSLSPRDMYTGSANENILVATHKDIVKEKPSAFQKNRRIKSQQAVPDEDIANEFPDDADDADDAMTIHIIKSDFGSPADKNQVHPPIDELNNLHLPSMSSTLSNSPKSELEEDSSPSAASSSSSSSSSSVRISKRKNKHSPQPSILKRLARYIWHFLPLLVLGCWSIGSFFRVSKIFDGLARSEILEWRENGNAVILRNRTTLYVNGTISFYNGSSKHADGTWNHIKKIDYEDLAECAADRLTLDTKSALETSLNTRLDERVASEIRREILEPHCGFTSNRRFQSWSRITESDAPILYPTNDTEVVDAIRAIGDAGCKIRPVGGHHSDSGISIDTIDKRAVGISLAKFREATDSEWSLANKRAVRRRLQEEKRVRAEAGLTFMKLNSIVRPSGYHLPTLPETWSLSLGGAIAGLVPGSTYGHSFVGGAVTRLRVALADGRITEIADPLDLAMWRGSMGLNGLILSIEFEVVAHKRFSMGTRKTHIHEWNPWFLDAAVSSLLPGAQGGQYMFDPWTDDLVGVGFVTQKPRQRLLDRVTGSSTSPQFQSDADCTFDVTRMQCNFLEACEYRFELGDFLPAHSCRLKRRPDPSPDSIRESYAALENIIDEAQVSGLPATPDYDFIDSCFWDLSIDKVSRSAHSTHGMLNDGFWYLGSSRSVAMSYFFPVSKLFRALDIFRTLVRELVIRNAPYTMRDAPVSFQFVRFQERSHVLLPRNAPSGDFVSIQVRILTPDNSAKHHMHGWRYALAELEQRWKVAFPDVPIFPNPGHLFAFHVFRTGNATREETLLARYRRIRRVRDAFQTLKRHYEARSHEERSKVKPPQQRRFSFFSSSPIAPEYTFEEIYRIEDPSTKMLAEVRAEIAEAETEAELLGLQKEHEAARLQVDQENDFFGSVHRELLQEAYFKEERPSEAATMGSVPVPFMDPRTLQRMFSQAQMGAFLRYRQSIDPENRFWGGKATHFFPKKLKWSMSNSDDPDSLAEAFLILDLKKLEMRSEVEREARKHMFTMILVFAIFAYCSYRIGRFLCAGRRRGSSRRKLNKTRSRRSSVSEDDYSDSSDSDSSSSSVSSASSRSSSSSN